MDTTVGYVLLVSAAVPAIIGWDFVRRGFNDVGTATDEAKKVAAQAAKQVADATDVAAAASGPQAVDVAEATREASVQIASVQDAVNGVNNALNELTGRFAPARVAFALASLLVIAALFALGVLSASAGSESSGSTTTTTSTVTTTP